MISRDEFIRRNRHKAAGIIALGSAKVNKLAIGPFDGAMQYGKVMLDIAETADWFLGELYDDIARSLQPKPAGQPAQPKRSA